MKQYEAVIETLDKLGGVATLGELNREVFKKASVNGKQKLHLPVSAALCNRLRGSIR